MIGAPLTEIACPFCRKIDSFLTFPDDISDRDWHTLPPMSVDNAEKAHILARLERLQTLLDHLEKVTIDLAERKQVRIRIRRQLDAAKKAVRTLATHDPV